MYMSFLKESKTVVRHVSSVNVTIAVVVLWVPVIITVADY